jgi:oligopeptide transport system permease protein
LAYLLGVPIGIAMARNKGKWFDKIATAYIVFILAVPSLVYIFIFRTVGMAIKLPGKFDIDDSNPLQYVLPIVSLALPSVAGLMQWLRRYMIDQMNSDYVKFARSGGMSERGIFTKHILKNAAIPLVHNIPGTILGALVGAFITETIYSVPGTGRMLTEAINLRDNSVIVGLAAFYSMLSIISLILGDILMALVDPRISFSDKAR